MTASRDRYKTAMVQNASGLDITMTRYGRPDAPLFWVRPRVWLAWWLRKLADKLDGTTSYTFDGNLPHRCNGEDWKDAMEYGFGAACRYLADLSRDRQDD